VDKFFWNPGEDWERKHEDNPEAPRGVFMMTDLSPPKNLGPLKAMVISFLWGE